MLLDRDRRRLQRVRGIHAEDMELFRSEIQRMQETEVQALEDSFKVHRSELAYLKNRDCSRRSRGSEAQARRSEAQARRQIVDLQNVVREMENSTTWRLFEPRSPAATNRDRRYEKTYMRNTRAVIINRFQTHRGLSGPSIRVAHHTPPSSSIPTPGKEQPPQREQDLACLRKRYQNLGDRPLMSILIPVLRSTAQAAGADTEIRSAPSIPRLGAVHLLRWLDQRIPSRSSFLDINGWTSG